MKSIAALTLLLALTVRAGDIATPRIGSEMPAFTLKNYDGKEVSLARTLREHPLTVLVFVSTECPVSNAYNGRMQALAESCAAKHIAFVGLNANKAESAGDIAAHAKAHGFTFPVLKDAANVIADSYGAQVTPEAFVLDAKGMLKYHGRIDDNRRADKVSSNDLADALSALAAGKPVANPEPRAFGCSIKRVDRE